MILTFICLCSIYLLCSYTQGGAAAAAPAASPAAAAPAAAPAPDPVPAPAATAAATAAPASDEGVLKQQQKRSSHERRLEKGQRGGGAFSTAVRTQLEGLISLWVSDTPHTERDQCLRVDQFAVSVGSNSLLRYPFNLPGATRRLFGNALRQLTDETGELKYPPAMFPLNKYNHFYKHLRLRTKAEVDALLVEEDTDGGVQSSDEVLYLLWYCLYYTSYSELL